MANPNAAAHVHQSKAEHGSPRCRRALPFVPKLTQRLRLHRLLSALPAARTPQRAVPLPSCPQAHPAGDGAFASATHGDRDQEGLSTAGPALLHFAPISLPRCIVYGATITAVAGLLTGHRDRALFMPPRAQHGQMDPGGQCCLQLPALIKPPAREATRSPSPGWAPGQHKAICSWCRVSRRAAPLLRGCSWHSSAGGTVGRQGAEHEEGREKVPLGCWAQREPALPLLSQTFYAVSFLMVVVYAYEAYRTIHGWRAWHVAALQVSGPQPWCSRASPFPHTAAPAL